MHGSASRLDNDRRMMWEEWPVPVRGEVGDTSPAHVELIVHPQYLAKSRLVLDAWQLRN